MKTRKKIFIQGTGTVGYPFIERLILLKQLDHPYFDWEEIIFSKDKPLTENIPRINRLFETATKSGAKLSLCVSKDKFRQFKEVGYRPIYFTGEAIEIADVVFDATPAGGQNKVEFYDKFAADRNKIFVAEGSEFKKKKQFGEIFIGGINEEPILTKLREGSQFFVVGSCNAHTIARNVHLILTAFPGSLENIWIIVHVLRRSDDLNRERVAISFSFSKPNKEYGKEGSYHVYNVLKAFESVGITWAQINETVAELNDPFMHCLLWEIFLPPEISDAEERLREAIKNDPFCGITWYSRANKTYCYSRETDKQLLPWFKKEGCWLHTIVYGDSLEEVEGLFMGHRLLKYGTFTPQDLNVIWSSLEMASMAKNPDEFDKNEFLKITAPLFEPKEI